MTTEGAIVPTISKEQQAIELVTTLANIVRALRTDVFQADTDYGIIPGTTKPTLLLPGMEKLLRALRLRPEYHALTVIEDFEKPLFMYRYECRLYEVESGLQVAAAHGSANSYETKWRWRESQRLCPTCGKPAIIKGKEEYGGGWICFAKKGGCGAKFKVGDQSIEGQTVGRIENPEIYDQINTIDKIAQKRALASAIKGAANVSEFFTVDLEDLPHYDAEVTVITPEKPATPKNAVIPTETGIIIDMPNGAGADGKRKIPPTQITSEADQPYTSGRTWLPDLETELGIRGHKLNRNHLMNVIKLLKGEGVVTDETTFKELIGLIVAREEAKELPPAV